MKNTMIFKKTAIAASIALLTACGGSGTGTTASTQSTSVGTITGFGSIVFDDGNKYDTDATNEMTSDGVPTDISGYKVGDKCVITGTVNGDGTGTATAVHCKDELEGFVSDVSGMTDNNGKTGTMVVMGQTVTITLDTVFESDNIDDSYTSIDQVVAGDVIEVSGYSDGNGTVLASRVETKLASDADIEVKGLVSGYTDGATSFTIGTLVVDITSLTGTMPPLSDGLYIEVKAETAPTTDVNGVQTLVATAIEIEDGGDMDVEGENIELNLTGLVSDMVPEGFTFNGSTFIDYEFVDIEDTFVITEGMKITVEGYIDADGVFVPEEVVEEPETENETYGYVTSVAEGTISISMDNGDTVETFTVNNETRMIDELNHEQYFKLLDLAGMDNPFVEIGFYTTDSGEMIATEVELEAAPAPSNTAM